MSTAVRPRRRIGATADDADGARRADINVVFGITGALAKVMTFRPRLPRAEATQLRADRPSRGPRDPDRRRRAGGPSVQEEALRHDGSPGRDTAIRKGQRVATTPFRYRPQNPVIEGDLGSIGRVAPTAEGAR